MSKRRDVLRLAGLPLAGLGPAMLFAAPPERLSDVVLGADQVQVTKEAFGETRVYFDGPTAAVQHMTAGSLRLNPGASPHPPHQHEEEEFLLVTEGTGELSIEGKVTKAGPGTMLFCGSNKMHGVVNTGETPLLFYFYKWK